MAYAIGTADDFMDFLRKIRDFATGVLDPATDSTFTDGIAVPAAQQWTELVPGSTSSIVSIPASGFATDGELYMMGPGSDVDDEIIIGFRTYRNVGANIWGWEMRGYTAFFDTLDWDTMPGVSPSCYAAFDDELMDIWIWVNARRIMACARVGTTDILIHAGFIQQFGTRSQYPYPLMIGGSSDLSTTSFQTNNFAHSCLPDPARTYLRWVDGSWKKYANYSGTTDQRGSARIQTGRLYWPQRDPFSAEESTSGKDNSETEIFENFVTGSDTYISPSIIDAYPLFPTVLMSSTENAIVGRVDGLYTTFGLGLVTGDTITVGAGSSAEVYDVFANTWRSEPPDFFAVKRE